MTPSSVLGGPGHEPRSSRRGSGDKCTFVVARRSAETRPAGGPPATYGWRAGGVRAGRAAPVPDRPFARCSSSRRRRGHPEASCCPSQARPTRPPDRPGDHCMTQPAADKPSVLYVCVHNAGRSQMAAAYHRHLSGGAVEVLSAGSEPATRSTRRPSPRWPRTASTSPPRRRRSSPRMPSRPRRRHHHGLRRHLPDLPRQALRGLGARGPCPARASSRSADPRRDQAACWRCSTSWSHTGRGLTCGSAADEHHRGPPAFRRADRI